MPDRLYNFFKKGIFLSLFLGISLFANPVLFDSVGVNKKFINEVSKLSDDLKSKTGIDIKLAIYKDTNGTIDELQQSILGKIDDNTIVLLLVKDKKFVDIIAKNKELFKLFNKAQILSPSASFLQALYVAVFYTQNFKQFKDVLKNSGGTILPILAQKTKTNKQEISKIEVALYNGLSDMVEQIAKNKGVKLDTKISNTNSTIFEIIKFIFYGMMIYFLVLYIKRRKNG